MLWGLPMPPSPPNENSWHIITLGKRAQLLHQTARQHIEWVRLLFTVSCPLTKMNTRHNASYWIWEMQLQSMMNDGSITSCICKCMCIMHDADILLKAVSQGSRQLCKMRPPQKKNPTFLPIFPILGYKSSVWSGVSRESVNCTGVQWGDGYTAPYLTEGSICSWVVSFIIVPTVSPSFLPDFICSSCSIPASASTEVLKLVSSSLLYWLSFLFLLIRFELLFVCLFVF